MAKFILNDAFITVNAVDLSARVQSITINYSAEILDATCMSDTSRDKVVGYKDWSVDLTFAQDYIAPASNAVDSTLFALVGAAATAIVIRPDSAAKGATNPEFTGNAYVENYQPVHGDAGAIATAPVTLQGSGALGRAVA